MHMAAAAEACGEFVHIDERAIGARGLRAETEFDHAVGVVLDRKHRRAHRGDLHRHVDDARRFLHLGAGLSEIRGLQPHDRDRAARRERKARERAALDQHAPCAT